jgi:type I restriction enzyme S subunit
MPENTIIFVVRGMSLKTEFRVGIARCPVAFGQDCKAIIARPGIEPYFLANVLRAKAPDIVALADEARHGTGRLQTGALAEVEVPVPPLVEQNAIACILSALDDKIELNRWMNQTLEAMARVIFNSWFVDFDPVRAKVSGHEPPGFAPQIADLFSNAFEGSQFGEIPEGWKVAMLSGIAFISKRSVKPSESPESLWEHYSIPAFDAGRIPASQTGESIKSAKYRVPCSAVLVSKLNPQFPRVWMPKVQDEKAAVCSTEFIPFVPRRSEWQPFLYELVKSDCVQRGISERVTGSTGSRQRAKPEDIASIRIVQPPSSLLEQFSQVVGPIHQRSHGAIMESQTLAELRDALLPRLISGELRVSDAERIVERCV